MGEGVSLLQLDDKLREKLQLASVANQLIANAGQAYAKEIADKITKIKEAIAARQKAKAAAKAALANFNPTSPQAFLKALADLKTAMETERVLACSTKDTLKSKKITLDPATQASLDKTLQAATENLNQLDLANATCYNTAPKPIANGCGGPCGWDFDGGKTCVDSKDGAIDTYTGVVGGENKKEISYYVVLRAFIPQDKIEMPKAFGVYYVPSGLFYGVAYHRGDNRREYLWDAEKKYRTEQYTYVDFLKKVHTEHKIASGSEGLDKNGKVVVYSDPTEECGAVNVEFKDEYKSVKINFEIEAVNKAEIKAQLILPITPSINAKVEVIITPQSDNSFDYKVYIPEMDGFPAYELWIYDNKNDKPYLLFGQNPIESGEDPLSLFGDGEHSYRFKGNSKSLKSARKFTFSEMKNLAED